MSRLPFPAKPGVLLSAVPRAYVMSRGHLPGCLPRVQKSRTKPDIIGPSSGEARRTPGPSCQVIRGQALTFGNRSLVSPLQRCPFGRANQRRLSRLSERPHRAARLRRTRYGFELAVATVAAARPKGGGEVAGISESRQEGCVFNAKNRPSPRARSAAILSLRLHSTRSIFDRSRP